MCFSLLASVAAGTTLTVAGVATVRMARRPAELPLALVPGLFGAQQLAEAVVWWSLLHDDARLSSAATVAYMLFSHVLWPVFVPFAMLCLEAVPWRRRTLGAALALGAVVAVEGLLIVLRGPATPQICGSSIQYPMPSAAFLTLYVLATCVGTAFSGRALLRAIGVAALGLALLALWFYAAVFVSVWCFFCAVLSLMIVGYFRRSRRSEEAARARPPSDVRSRRTRARAGSSAPAAPGSTSRSPGG